MRVILDQADQRQRIDAGIGSELDAAMLRANIDLDDTQRCAAQFQRGDSEQGFHLFGQQAEAIDHFHLQILQIVIVVGIGDTFVQGQACVHVRQVVVRDQCRQAQVDIRAAAERILQFRLLTLLDGLDRPLQHIHVQGEADRLDLSALAFTEQFTGAADFQVMGGQGEAGPQVLCGGNGFQALFRIAGELASGRGQQVGIGLVVTAADPSAQLVQLRQAELVGALDDDGIGAGHVDAGLDDGRGHQDIEAAMIEVAHHLFQRPFRHLPMADADARFRYQFRQVGCAFLDGFHFVVQEVHLAAAQQLAQYRFLDHCRLLLHDEGLDRQSPCRRGGDDRQVAHAGHGHVQRARDWRSSEVEDIHLAAQGLETFLLAYPEAVFLVDDHQAQVLELHITLQQFVGADHDVDLAVGQVLGGRLDFLGGAEAGNDLDLDRPVGEAILEAVVMLLGEQGGGHQYGDLLAAVYSEECGAHGDFGLAEADIAADQAVHRLCLGHVLHHGVDGGLLVGGFLEGEGVGEGLVVLFRLAETEALARGPAGVHVQQLGGHIANLFRRFASSLLPLFGAESVQRGVVIIGAGIAGDHVQVRHRHVERGLIGVLELEELCFLAFHAQVDQAAIATHAMIDMHHRCAFAQLGQVADEGVAQVGRLAAPPALHHPLAEQLTFGDQGDGRVLAQQPLIHRCDHDGARQLTADEVGPAVHGLRLQGDTCQQFQQRLAAAGGFGDEQRAAVEAFEEALQFAQRLFQLAVQWQLGRRAAVEIGDAGPCGQGLVVADDPRIALEQGEAFLHPQKQLRRVQQGSGRVDALFFVAIAHIGPELGGAVLDAGQAEQ